MTPAGGRAAAMEVTKPPMLRDGFDKAARPLV